MKAFHTHNVRGTVFICCQKCLTHGFQATSLSGTRIFALCSDFVALQGSAPRRGVIGNIVKVLDY